MRGELVLTEPPALRTAASNTEVRGSQLLPLVLLLYQAAVQGGEVQAGALHTHRKNKRILTSLIKTGFWRKTNHFIEDVKSYLKC